MFLAPIGTDAPIYHFPWGTIGLIILNTLILLASTLGLLPPVDVLADDYALAHGEGLHPLQWVTSNFLHDGWWHLIGNLVFLWPFGLIIEGKLGWQRFLAVYLGLGIAECLLEQICLRGPGASLGASSIIFGLVAIACVWAPRNDVEMVYGIWAPFFVRIDTFDFPVIWLSLLMVAKEAVIAAWLNFPIGSELFHLVGAALGAGVGLSFLRSGLVDCEGWDLPSILRKERQSRTVLLNTEATVLDGRSAELDAIPAEAEKTKQTGRKIRALTRIQACLNAGDAAGAWAELLRTRQVLDGFQLGQRDLVRLAQSQLDAERWREAIAAYEEVIERFPSEATVARLLIAEVLIERQRRPSAGLRHLEAIDSGRLTGHDPETFERLKRRAADLIDAGVVELEGQAWGSS